MSFDQRIRNIIQDEIRMGVGVRAGAKKKKTVKSCVKRKPVKRTKKQCIAWWGPEGGPKQGRCKEFGTICRKKKGGVVVEDVGSLWHPEMYGSPMYGSPMMGRGMVGSARHRKRRGRGVKPWSEGQTMGCYEYCDNQGYGTNPWIIFLKNYGRMHGLKYNEVLKVPGIGDIYKQYKMSGQY
jgi:hypothetical protein